MKNNDQALTLMDQVRAIPGGEHVSVCYSCGTCVSRCLIQQKIDKAYNPRRMMKMVMMDMLENAFDSPTTWLCSACDLCYPACPQEIHISGVITAVKELAIEAGHHSPLKTAQVNIKTCVACGLCVEVCPYEAVHLVEKNVPNRGKNLTNDFAFQCIKFLVWFQFFQFSAESGNFFLNYTSFINIHP